MRELRRVRAVDAEAVGILVLGQMRPAVFIGGLIGGFRSAIAATQASAEVRAQRLRLQTAAMGFDAGDSVRWPAHCNRGGLTSVVENGNRGTGVFPPS